MYNLPHFKANSNDDVIAFMHTHPFITLCGVDKNSKPVATHIPVLIVQKVDKLFLQGHLMLRQNHTNAFEDNSNVLAIFLGSNAYVSASNYTQKNVASTWNYQAIHASGIIHFKDDTFLFELLRNLTEKFEHNSQSPSLVDKIPEEYMKQNMKAIVGIEIEITNVEHIFKLSQNKDEISRENIIEHLKNKDDMNAVTVANAMVSFYQKQ